MELYTFLAPEIIFGLGALEQAGESLARLGAKRVFVVSDPGVIAAGWVDKVIPVIREAGLDYQIWHDLTSNPKDYEVHQGLEKYREFESNAVLGVGGGSVIDTAKAIALLSSNGGNIRDYEGADKIQRALPPVVTAPTTAGSGSEVSQLAVITNSQCKMKMVLGAKSLIPDIALVDPRTLTTKNRELTANTGFDVLTHAIEAYVSQAASPLTDIHALNAMTLVFRYLPLSMSSNSNLEAKTAMAMASLQAGLALSNALLGLVHAMSHQLGGLLDMPHGEANAILLPHIMEYNLPAAMERYGKIARAMEQNIQGLSRREAAQKAVDAVRQLAKDVGIAEDLSQVGLDRQYLERLSDNAMRDVCLLTNPRDVSKEDILKLFKSLSGSL